MQAVSEVLQFHPIGMCSCRSVAPVLAIADSGAFGVPEPQWKETPVFGTGVRRNELWDGPCGPGLEPHDESNVKDDWLGQRRSELGGGSTLCVPPHVEECLFFLLLGAPMRRAGDRVPAVRSAGVLGENVGCSG